MKNNLKILLLEDSDLDAELLQHILSEEGIECSITRAANQKEFFSAINQFEFDVILSDNTLPDYDGLSALKYAREHKPHIPFIFVSGTIGEERAVEALRHGARDYVLKQHINKLVPALQRVTHESKIEQAKIRAEKELRASEEKYRRLVNEVNDGFYITDQHGNITFANAALAKMLGYGRVEDLIGHNFLEFIPGEKANQFARQYKSHLEMAKPPDNFEVEVLRIDGLTAYLDMKPVLIIEQGKVFGTRGVIRNITERKRAEIEIISQKNRFEQLFNNSPIATALLDIQDKVLLINEAFTILFGYFIEEIRGKNINDLLVPIDRRNEAQSFSNETHLGHQVNKESYRKKKDGTLAFVQIIGVPVIINDKTAGIYGMYVDLSVRKKAEEELLKAKIQSEEMNRLKSCFLSNMSHELRTPLISVLGFAELLQQEVKDPDHLEWVGHIFEGGLRLQNTLNTILEFSRLETESASVKTEICKLADQIEKQLKTFQNAARIKNLYLRSLFVDRDIKANINIDLFNKALFHVVSNAIKFTKRGGVTISLDIERLNDRLFAVIKVSDTGIGIAENKIKSLFTEFRQISEGMNRDYEGVGLGLALTKRIVGLLNGNIEVKSEIGAGSEFSIYLPAIPSESEITKEIDFRRTTHQIDAGPFVDRDKVSILVVEDNFSNRSLMKRILKNYELVAEAEDGISGISLATQRKFDLVLMDINLGSGIDGIETMHRIRKIPGYFNTPIIAVTAYAMGGDKERFKSEGFDAYLAKPFPRESLIEVVNKYLRKAKLDT
ncbi:MAG: PAS domain S-box protein [Bacteroidota bacterium]